MVPGADGRGSGGMAKRTGPSLSVAIHLAVASALGLYFTFAAVQGEFGLFRRVQVEAEVASLREELAGLDAAVEARRNLVRRLSDDFLDIDLLDERARAVLGYMGEGEILLR
jgi:cell division protein FtsB